MLVRMDEVNRTVLYPALHAVDELDVVLTVVLQEVLEGFHLLLGNLASVDSVADEGLILFLVQLVKFRLVGLNGLRQGISPGCIVCLIYDVCQDST